MSLGEMEWVPNLLEKCENLLAYFAIFLVGQFW
jgi:hypothetical protein